MIKRLKIRILIRNLIQQRNNFILMIYIEWELIYGILILVFQIMNVNYKLITMIQQKIQKVGIIKCRKNNNICLIMNQVKINMKKMLKYQKDYGDGKIIIPQDVNMVQAAELNFQGLNKMDTTLKILFMVLELLDSMMVQNVLISKENIKNLVIHGLMHINIILEVRKEMENTQMKSLTIFHQILEFLKESEKILINCTLNKTDTTWVVLLFMKGYQEQTQRNLLKICQWKLYHQIF